MNLKITFTNLLTNKEEFGFFASQLEADKYVDNLKSKYLLKDGEYSVVSEDITAEVQAAKDKEAADKIKIEELKLKDKDMKLSELIELLQLEGVI